MARKRENTETDGTGLVAAGEEAGTAAFVVAGEGLMEGMAVRGAELFSDVAAGCSVDEEFCLTPAAEPRLALASG
jgi:hypothetical protein